MQAMAHTKTLPANIAGHSSPVAVCSSTSSSLSSSKRLTFCGQSEGPMVNVYVHERWCEPLLHVPANRLLAELWEISRQKHQNGHGLLPIHVEMYICILMGVCVYYTRALQTCIIYILGPLLQLVLSVPGGIALWQFADIPIDRSVSDEQHRPRGLNNKGVLSALVRIEHRSSCSTVCSRNFSRAFFVLRLCKCAVCSCKCGVCSCKCARASVLLQSWQAILPEETFTMLSGKG